MPNETEVITWATTSTGTVVPADSFRPVTNYGSYDYTSGTYQYGVNNYFVFDRRQELDSIFSNIHKHIQEHVEEFKGLTLELNMNNVERVIKCSCGGKWQIDLTIAKSFSSYNNFCSYIEESVNRLNSLYLKKEIEKIEDEQREFINPIDSLEL